MLLQRIVETQTADLQLQVLVAPGASPAGFTGVVSLPALQGRLSLRNFGTGCAVHALRFAEERLRQPVGDIVRRARCVHHGAEASSMRQRRVIHIA